MDLEISQFTIDTYEQVMAIWTDIPGIGFSDADSKENINRYLDRNPGMSFFAEKDGQIVGAVLCGHDGRRGYIHHLAVHANYRRQGIGRKLIDHCISALVNIGIKKCHLFIFKDNKVGMRFWESLAWSYRSDMSVISKNIQ